VLIFNFRGGNGGGGGEKKKSVFTFGPNPPPPPFSVGASQIKGRCVGVQ